MDLYKALGIEKTASEAEIRRAYRNQAKKTHPDTGGNVDKFTEIGKALRVLTNPALRERYDRTGETEESADNTFSRVTQLALQAILAVTSANKAQIEFVDVISTAIVTIEDQKRQNESKVAEVRAEKRALERVLKRTKKKKGSDGVLLKMMEVHLHHLTDLMAKGETETAIFAQAAGLLKGYSCAAEVQGAPMMGSFFISSTTGTGTGF